MMVRFIGFFVILGVIGYAMLNILEDTYGNKLGDAPEKDTVGIEKGMLAPDFELTSLTGETVKLSELKGKKVMINFWASWCPPCKKEMPEIQSFYENKQENEIILAINATQTEVKPQDPIDYINSNGYTFPVLMDTEGIVTDHYYKIVSIPTTYFIDSTGRISKSKVGPLTYEEIKDNFNKMD